MGLFVALDCAVLTDFLLFQNFVSSVSYYIVQIFLTVLKPLCRLHIRWRHVFSLILSCRRCVDADALVIVASQHNTFGTLCACRIQYVRVVIINLERAILFLLLSIVTHLVAHSSLHKTLSMCVCLVCGVLMIVAHCIIHISRWNTVRSR